MFQKHENLEKFMPAIVEVILSLLVLAIGGRVIGQLFSKNLN